VTTRPIPIRLRDLRLGEEFVTAITHRLGRVLEWGHVRPRGYWRQTGDPRPRWPVVLCQVGAQRLLLSPEVVVLVGASRQHWRIADASPGRWAERISAGVA